MPATDRLDRRLDRLLAAVAEQLAASGRDRVLVHGGDLDDLGAEGAAILRTLGLLAPCEPARTVLCERCDRECVMEVLFASGLHHGASRAFVVCDRRDDIGRVPVDPERLRQ